MKPGIEVLSEGMKDNFVLPSSKSERGKGEKKVACKGRLVKE